MKSMPACTFNQAEKRCRFSFILTSNRDLPNLRVTSFRGVCCGQGLTAGILIEVAKMIYGQQPEFDDAIPGGPPYSDILYNGTSVVMRTRHVAEI